MGPILERREIESVTTYADMQEAYVRYRDARGRYTGWLQDHALSSVKGFEAHLELDKKRTSLNGADQRYVEIGDPYSSEGFKAGTYQRMEERGDELHLYMRLVLEESERSHHKAWVTLKLACAKQGDSVIYLIEPHDMRDIEPVTVRLPARLEPAQRTDLYQAMSDVVIRVLDPTPYED